MYESSGLPLWIRRSRFNSLHTVTACGPSDGKEVKDVLGHPGARVEVGSARKRPLPARDIDAQQ